MALLLETLSLETLDESMARLTKATEKALDEEGVNGVVARSIPVLAAILRHSLLENVRKSKGHDICLGATICAAKALAVVIINHAKPDCHPDVAREVIQTFALTLIDALEEYEKVMTPKGSAQ